MGKLDAFTVSQIIECIGEAICAMNAIPTPRPDGIPEAIGGLTWARRALMNVAVVAVEVEQEAA